MNNSIEKHNLRKCCYFIFFFATVNYNMIASLLYTMYSQTCQCSASPTIFKYYMYLTFNLHLGSPLSSHPSYLLDEMQPTTTFLLLDNCIILKVIIQHIDLITLLRNPAYCLFLYCITMQLSTSMLYFMYYDEDPFATMSLM